MKFKTTLYFSVSLFRQILQYFSENEYIKDLNVFVGYTDEIVEGNYISKNGVRKLELCIFTNI